jgi:hypothetical protein
MTKSHKIINTTCATNTPDMGGLVRRCRAQEKPFLAVPFVSQLGNFGHDTFQLDIELVDNRLRLPSYVEQHSPDAAEEKYAEEFQEF